MVYLHTGNSERDCIQRIVLAATRAKPVREPEKLFLIDGIEHFDHGTLDNLVFQRGDPERPLSIAFRYKLPPRGQRPIGPAV